MDTSARPHRIIPAWMLPLLALPVRRWFDPSVREVLALLRPGLKVLEVGPGHGFHTLPVARALDGEGRLTCVELQEAGRRGLRRRLVRRGLEGRVDIRACEPTDLGVADLAGTQDLALAIAVLHEMPDPEGALGQIARALKPGGRLLVLEPRGHVTEAGFEAEVRGAEAAGLCRELTEDGGRYLRARFLRPA